MFTRKNICLIFIAIFTFCSAFAVELIPNSSFELPIAKSFSSGKKNSIKRVKIDAYSGNYSVRVKLNESVRFGNVRGRGCISPKSMIEVQAGKSYTLKFYVKPVNVLRFIVQIFYMPADQKKKDQKLINLAAGKWTEVIMPFIVPANTKKVKINIWGHATGMDSYFDIDNITVEKQGISSRVSTSKVEDKAIYLPLSNQIVKIDGNINEKVWKTLPWHGNFLHYKTLAAAKHKTEFKLFRTTAGFFIAVKAFGGRAKADITKRDGKIHQDDVVELFFTPEFCDGAIHQFVFNALGTQFDTKLSGTGKSWNADWQVKTKVTTDGYNAELFIPFKSIGVGKDNLFVGFNIARESSVKDSRRDISSWSGVVDKFSYFQDYGRLIFGKKSGKAITVNSVIPMEDKVEITCDVPSGGEIVAWVNYFQKLNIKSFKYNRKYFSLNPGKNKIEVPILENTNPGIQFVNILCLKNGQITAAKTVSFRIVKLPRFLKTTYKIPVLIPTVKEAAWDKKSFKLDSIEKIIYYPTKNGYEAKTALKIKKYIGDYCHRNITINKGGQAFPKTGAIVLGSLNNTVFATALEQYNRKIYEKLNTLPSKGQGYVVNLDQTNVILAGQDPAGAYYAFRTLLQIVKFDAANIVQATITDWPDHQRRAYGMNVWTAYRGLFKKLTFELLAGFKYNYLFLEFNNNLQYKSHPEIARVGAFSHEEVKAIIKYANENFITVIPRMESYSHSDWFLKSHPEFMAFPNTKFKRHKMVADVNHPDYYKFIFDVTREQYELFGKPDIFHICHDELWYHPEEEPVYTARTGNTPKNQLWLQDILKMCGFLKKLGVKMPIMWADTLIPNFNGGAPMYFDKIRDKLPKDYLAPMHWVCESAPVKNQEKYLTDAKFKNVLWSHNTYDCTPYLPRQPEKMWLLGSNKWGPNPPFFTVSKNDEAHLIWNFVRTIHDADIFWNVKTLREDMVDFQYRKGNALLRYTVDNSVSENQELVPLAISGRSMNFNNWRRDRNFPADGFNFSKIKELKKSRFKKLNNDGKAAVVSSKGKKISFAVNKKADSIIVLHSLHIIPSKIQAYKKNIGREFWQSGRTGKTMHDVYQVGSYIIKYANGQQYEHKIILGYNIYSWNTSDILRFQYDTSELWRVDNGDTHATAFVHVIKNPYPNKIIKNIQLLNNSDAVELALFSAATILNSKN